MNNLVDYSKYYNSGLDIYELVEQHPKLGEYLDPDNNSIVRKFMVESRMTRKEAMKAGFYMLIALLITIFRTSTTSNVEDVD